MPMQPREQIRTKKCLVRFLSDRGLDAFCELKFNRIFHWMGKHIQNTWTWPIIDRKWQNMYCNYQFISFLARSISFLALNWYFRWISRKYPYDSRLHMWSGFGGMQLPQNFAPRAAVFFSKDFFPKLFHEMIDLYIRFLKTNNLQLEAACGHVESLRRTCHTLQNSFLGGF